MLNSKTIGMAALVMSAALFPPVSAFAHTTIKSQTTEGVVDDNAIKIGHGCEAESGDRGVIAQSVVFPLDDATVTASNGSAVTLFNTIEQGSLVGLVASIQDANIFLSQQEKLDDNGNQFGFSGNHGLLALGKQGRVPFNFTAPNFVFTSCAKRLLVQIAIADICVRGKNKYGAGQANLWIPDNGSQYAALGKQQDNEGVGSPATLIVNRNLTTNPLAPACGAGIDVTVTPSAASVDANLPIPGFWK